MPNPLDSKVAKYPLLYSFVQAASQRRGFWEILIPMLPQIFDILMQFLEDCTKTEEQAIELLLTDDDRKLDYAFSKIHRRLWWTSKEFRRSDRVDRRRAVWDAIRAVQDEVVDSSDEFSRAYAEVSSAA